MTTILGEKQKPDKKQDSWWTHSNCYQESLPFVSLNSQLFLISLSWNNTLNRSLFEVTHQGYFCLLQLQTSSTLPWRRQWHPTPVFLPGKSYGWRSLVGYSPWVRRVPMAEHIHIHKYSRKTKPNQNKKSTSPLSRLFKVLSLMV